MGLVSVQLGLLAVAKDTARADLGDVEIAAERATSAGHRVMVQQVVGDDEAAIRETLERWIADPTIDVILVLAGDSDAVSNAMQPLVGNVLPGFTDLFRLLFFQEAGASAMLSAAEAARCSNTFVFALPGAVAAAMDKLILPQFDPTTTPKNLVGQMPRLRTEPGNAPEALTDEASAGHGVPREVQPEKTQGGSGLPARLPAMPAPRRDQKRTGANVIARTPNDPATKPIDVARLEREIAASAQRDDVTRRTDLQKLLPRVPPGADDISDDEAEDNDDVTHADIIAAPPAGKPFAIPAIAKPAAPVTINPRKKEPAARSTPNPADVGRAAAVPIQKTPLPSIQKTPLPSIAKDPSTNGSAKAAAKPAPASASPGISTTPASRATPEPPLRLTPEPPSRATPPPASLAATTAPSGAPLASIALVKAAVAKAAPDEAVTAARPVPTLDELMATRPPAQPALDEQVTTARAPILSPRSSGSIGVLSDADLEAVDTDSEGSDLDVIRAAATAHSDEAPTVTRAEPVKVPSPPPAPTTTPPATTAPAVVAPAATPRTRPPTAPPPAKAVDPLAPTEVARARPKTTPPPAAEASDLPRGTFNYPVQQKKMHWALKLLLFVLVLGAGFGGFVVLFGDKLGGGSDQPAAKSDAAVAAIADAEVVAVAEVADAAVEIDAAETEPEIEMTPPTPTPPKAGSASERPKPPRGERPPKNPPPEKGSAAAPVDAAVASLPTPPTGPSNTPPGAGGDECDETACVLSNYDKPCCAKFKPAATGDITPRAGGLPETLDKVMVRAGVNGVKPKVQKCGEKIATKGTVKIAMTVSAEGAVTDASVADSPDPALGDCVLAAMRLAKFGKSVNGGTFTYPFVF